jgi:hypothetical protein
MVPKEMGILKWEMLTPTTREGISPTTSLFFILYHATYADIMGKNETKPNFLLH